MAMKYKVDAVEAEVKGLSASFAALTKFTAETSKSQKAWVKYGENLKQAHKIAQDIMKLSGDQALNTDRIVSSSYKMNSALGMVVKNFIAINNQTKGLEESLGRVMTSVFRLSIFTGLFGLLGAGGSLFGLSEVSSAVAARRRLLMGLGVSYGENASLGVNLGRFIDTGATVGNVFSGMYDYTNPAFVGLKAAGVAGKNANEQTIDLLRRLPQIMAGTPNELVGSKAQALGLTNLLSMQDIVRYLNASPKEREDQIKAYQSDINKFALSPETLKKWTDFNVTLNRAGLQIQTVLGDHLVSLSEPIQKFSEGAAKLVTALLSTEYAGKAIEGLARGIDWFGEALTGKKTEGYVKYFMEGVEKFLPIAKKIITAAAIVMKYVGGGAYRMGKLIFDPNYNPKSWGEVLLPPAGNSAPPPSQIHRIPNTLARRGRSWRGAGSGREESGTGLHDIPPEYAPGWGPNGRIDQPRNPRLERHAPRGLPDAGALNILPGHGATEGGEAEPGLIDAARLAQQVNPRIGFTALNDAYHQNGGGSGPHGAHGTGRAFDAHSNHIELDKQRMRDRLTAAGFEEGAWQSGQGDYSFEPGDGMAFGSTGPHLHFQWNNAAAAQRFHNYMMREERRRQNLPRAPINPYERRAPQETSYLDSLHQAARQPKSVVVQNNTDTSTSIIVNRSAFA